MRITKRGQHMTKYWPDSLSHQWSRQAVITVSRSTWMTTKIKWSRHRSFLYGFDRSPEVHVLKLGIEIPTLNNITGLVNWFENSKVREFDYM